MEVNFVTIPTCLRKLTRSNLAIINSNVCKLGFLESATKYKHCNHLAHYLRCAVVELDISAAHQADCVKFVAGLVEIHQRSA